MGAQQTPSPCAQEATEPREDGCPTAPGTLGAGVSSPCNQAWHQAHDMGLKQNVSLERPHSWQVAELGPISPCKRVANDTSPNAVITLKTTSSDGRRNESPWPRLDHSQECTRLPACPAVLPGRTHSSVPAQSRGHLGLAEVGHRPDPHRRGILLSRAL